MLPLRLLGIYHGLSQNRILPLVPALDSERIQGGMFAVNPFLPFPAGSRSNNISHRISAHRLPWVRIMFQRFVPLPRVISSTLQLIPRNNATNQHKVIEASPHKLHVLKTRERLERASRYVDHVYRRVG
ncbi:hypothetical protein AcW1_007793 [Taiwanofungus camphoratus]|nr:hypothetical protein AcW1_007793 [Antrodia cinnamomea]